MMEQLRILIVEDVFAESLRLEKELCEMGHAVCGIADNMKDALGLLLTEKPDMAIVDIMLNGQKDGITIVEKISSMTLARIPILFLTGFVDRHIFEEAKQLLTFGYLLKPFNKLELQYSIELAIERSDPERSDPERSAPGRPVLRGPGRSPERSSDFERQNIFIKRGNHLVKIPVQSVYYIEVEGKYCNVICEMGKFLIEHSLKEMLARLVFNDFLRIHRNYIINLNEVRELDLNDEVLILRNGFRVAMSRRFKTEFLEKFRPIR
jgi:DNA-binding LytR/AlgR family response regulator